MKINHNFILVFLISLGVAIVFFIGWQVIKENTSNKDKINPFEGITRPIFFSENPFEGNDGSKLQIFEWGNFACPTCREMQPIMEKIFTKYGDKIIHIWKDLPFANGVSDKAAIAARCAASQGKFWQYQVILFANQEGLGSFDYVKAAENLHLDKGKFTNCLTDKNIIKLIERDTLEAKALGIDITPVFVVGNRAFSGIASFEDFDSIVAEELNSL